MVDVRLGTAAALIAGLGAIVAIVLPTAGKAQVGLANSGPFD